MKGLFILLINLTATHLATVQANFDAYDNINDPDVIDFVSLFENKALPISTNSVLSDFNLRNMTKAPLSDAMIDRFLRKDDGTLITGALYKETFEDSLPEDFVEGKLYPLYKLPTNGNYLLLVYAQVDPDFEG